MSRIASSYAYGLRYYAYAIRITNPAGAAMTQSTLPKTEQAPTNNSKTAVRWWKRPWIFPLWIVCGIFFIMRVPSYLGFTPQEAIVPLRGYTHYLLLSGHIVLGTVALSCCCLQVWPWLRQHHPKVHRISGRSYVAVVIPASALAVVSSLMAAVPLPGRIGNVMLATLWLTTTLFGFRAARSRDFGAHRRWMLRSFALCFSIIMNRLWIVIWIVAFAPLQDSYYAGNAAAMGDDVAVASIWCSWIVNLLIVEWWIERKKRRPHKTSRPAIKVDA